MALPPDRTPPASSNKQDRDAAQQDGFLREVDEALRQDQMLGAVQRYGKPLAAAIVLGLAALAGYLWWDHSTKQAAAERSERTVLALDRLGSGGPAAEAAARDLEPLTTEGSDGSKAAAALLRAAISQEQGKGEEAAKAFAAIAADTQVPAPLRDYAVVRETAIRFDALPPQQVVDRLKPMAVPGNPWFGSAGEMTGLALLKLGKPDLAGAMFAAVAKDKEAPDSLRDRMRQMANQLGADAGEAPAPAQQP
ncbi:tetratricopeptide repeat protein [Novosphingobium sp.]|uniref:tetratricopeptide repeat protein n=1 Tax=Novosphingobium sp. TaxID=1874826 RepID=UPI0025DF3BA7|nr:tetratricopeptide repeat protein [Novosphingobium sp.]